MPKVSIIITTYNREKYLEEGIKSIRIQSFQDWELIIIDDCCTDKTADMIHCYQKKDKRIRYFYNRQNQGISISTNKAVKKARGKYIARLDDDDFWCDKDKLQKQVEFLEQNPDYAAISTSVIVVDEEGREIKKIKLPESDAEIRAKILYRNQMVHSGVLYRKKALLAIGPYRWALVGDYDLFLRFGKKYKLANLAQYSIAYRHTLQGLSRQKAVKQEILALLLVLLHGSAYPNFCRNLVKRVKDDIVFFWHNITLKK